MPSGLTLHRGRAEHRSDHLHERDPGPDLDQGLRSTSPTCPSRGRRRGEPWRSRPDRASPPCRHQEATSPARIRSALDVGCQWERRPAPVWTKQVGDSTSSGVAGIGERYGPPAGPGLRCTCRGDVSIPAMKARIPVRRRRVSTLDVRWKWRRPVLPRLREGRPDASTSVPRVCSRLPARSSDGYVAGARSSCCVPVQPRNAGRVAHMLKPCPERGLSGATALNCF